LLKLWNVLVGETKSCGMGRTWAGDMREIRGCVFSKQVGTCKLCWLLVEWRSKRKSWTRYWQKKKKKPCLFVFYILLLLLHLASEVFKRGFSSEKKSTLSTAFWCVVWFLSQSENKTVHTMRGELGDWTRETLFPIGFYFPLLTTLVNSSFCFYYLLTTYPPISPYLCTNHLKWPSSDLVTT
jgi:hypothetical protein